MAASRIHRLVAASARAYLVLESSTNRVSRRRDSNIRLEARGAMSLNLTSSIIHLDEHAFDAHIAAAELPILVDFWADWCAPCRAIAPMLEHIAEDLDGRVTIAKVDVDKAPALAARLNVRSIPTLALFRDGKLVDQFVGVRPESVLRKWLEERV